MCWKSIVNDSKMIRINIYENSYGKGGEIKPSRKIQVHVLLMTMVTVLIVGPSLLMSADSDNASSTARVLLGITVTSTPVSNTHLTLPTN